MPLAHVHICQIWVPQISLLLEKVHPRLQELAAPDSTRQLTESASLEYCVGTASRLVRRCNGASAWMDGSVTGRRVTACFASRSGRLRKAESRVHVLGCADHEPRLSSVRHAPQEINADRQKDKKKTKRLCGTYLLMVSESPITQRCRFGRVIATATPSKISLWPIKYGRSVSVLTYH
ncbi:hypothetical protein IAQ61_007571 [Plenodomus lingam]|uniref:uncharacterized protein n=1 Tax=Leptosphaeria maculans TaxID=5022 RepID=UPI003320DEF4|nr:hypothetical protein IAQ61_007571 [Plenodomus lingam]